MSAAWEKVRRSLGSADSIAWDGCHKIYVLMDADRTADMEECGYDPVLPVTDADQALATIREWWDNSCALRFVSAVKTVDGDANDGFTDLIAQFE